MKPALLASYLGLSLVSVLGAADPDAATIASRSLEARGGAAAFSGIRSLRITGRLEMQNDAAAPLVIAVKRPALFRLELGQGDFRILQIYDGSAAWRVSGTGSPKELDGAERDRVIDQAVNAIGGPLADWRDRGSTLEFAGREDLEGKPCYKIKITLKTGMVITQWIDSATYLEMREELTTSSGKAGDSSTIEETVGDYRTFAGMQFPCRFVSGPKGGTQKTTLVIDKIEINPELDSSLFHVPSANTK